MQITALLQVVKYMKELTGNPSFMDMYKQLAELIREASKNNHEDLNQKILELKEEIKSLQINSDPADWGYASYCLFERINSNRLFGKPAAEYLEQLVDHGTRDYNSMYTELNKTIKLLGKFTDNISKFSTLFDLLLPEEDIDKLMSGNNPTILLYFEGKLGVQSISDLERYSRLWDSILRSFCNLTGEEKPSVDISNFSNGNIVLGVAAGNLTLESIITGVDSMISCLPDILKIKRIQQELLTLPLHHEVADLLDQEIEYLISNAAQNVAGKLVNTSEEMIAAIALSLKQILSFIMKGGKIEYLNSESAIVDDRIKRNLNESFRTAREIEGMIEAIPAMMENKY